MQPKYAFLFPGLGLELVNSRQFFDAFGDIGRQVLAEADTALGFKLSELIEQGSFDLMKAGNAQAVLLASSEVITRALEREGVSIRGNASFVAGHSAGETSALRAAGSISFSEAVWLVHARGEAMEKAVPPGVGAMANLFGASIEKAEEIAAQASVNGEICAIGNDNMKGNVVFSGHATAIHRALAIAAEQGFRKKNILPISIPIHSPLMENDGQYAALLERVTIRDAAVPIVANQTGQEVTQSGEIINCLERQAAMRVRWRESMQHMLSRGTTVFVECGMGGMLTAMGKRIADDEGLSIERFAVNDPASLKAFIAAHGALLKRGEIALGEQGAVRDNASLMQAGAPQPPAPRT